MISEIDAQFVTSADHRLISHKAKQYVLIDSNTLTEKVKVLVNENYRILSYEYNASKYIKMIDYIFDLKYRVISYYSPKLNAILKKSLTVRQWEIVFGDFLYQILALSYECYNYIKQLPDNVYVIKDLVNTICSTTSYIGYKYAFCDEYRTEIIAIIMSRLGYSVQIKKDHRREYKVSYNEELCHRGQEWDGDVLVVESRMPLEMELEINNSCSGRIDFCHGFFLHNDNKIASINEIDLEKRRNFFSDFPYKNEFELCIDDILLNFIPVLLFEGVSDLYKFSSNIVDQWHYKKIFHSAYSSDLFRMCCALQKEKNIPVLSIQHALFYTVNNAVGLNEIKVNDGFVSWGWNDKDVISRTIIDAAINKQFSLPYKRTLGKGKILYAIGEREKEMGRGFSFRDYTLKQKRFLSSLTDDIRKRIVIRYRLEESTEDLMEFCEYNYPEISFECSNSKNFFDSLSECSFLITDYFSTTIVDAIFCGKPFCMFEGSYDYTWRHKAVESVNKLKEYGVYKEEPEALAQELKLHKNTDEWLENMFDELRNFVYSITNADKDIINIWSNVFRMR